MYTDMSLKKELTGAGSRIVVNFIKSFHREMNARAIKYSRLSKKDEDFTPIFFYGEQLTKTYVTVVLDKLCKGYLMQEAHVERKQSKFSQNHSLSNGRVDYWCRLINKTKLSILMEVKQGWIRYYSNGRWTVYKRATKKHAECAEQLKVINNKIEHAIDHLYTLALTILPVYIRYKNIREKPHRVPKAILRAIAEEAAKKAKASAWGVASFPADCCSIIEVEGLNETTHYENYPCLIYLWSVTKVTRR